MFRDFSEAAKEKLLIYVQEAIPKTTWDSVWDCISDFGWGVMEWLGILSSKCYIDELENYHKLILDKYDTTTAQLEQIFAGAKSIDSHYGTAMAEVVELGKQMTKFMNDLAESIDPSGGNLSIEQMEGTLAADIETIAEGKTTAEKVIEQEMIGADSAGTEYYGDPVNMTTGNFVYDHEDLTVGGEIGLAFHRYYNSKDIRIGSLGKCFTHNYEISLEKKSDGCIRVRMYDGQSLYFEKTEDGSYVGMRTALETIEEIPEGYLLRRVGLNCMQFDKTGKLLRVENNNGRGITFTYNDKKQLVEARADNSNVFYYCYDEQGMLVKVSDQVGREVLLTYEERLLKAVTLPSGGVYTYRYGERGRISEVVNASDVSTIRNEYDNKYRITRQELPDGGVMDFQYDDAKKQVICTERNGSKIIYVHDDKYRHTETMYEDGTKEK